MSKRKLPAGEYEVLISRLVEQKQTVSVYAKVPLTEDQLLDKAYSMTHNADWESLCSRPKLEAYRIEDLY